MNAPSQPMMRAAGSSAAWHYSTSTVSKADRAVTWQRAISRLNLPAEKLPSRDKFTGEVACLTSPMGIRFAVIKADELYVHGPYPKQSDAIWLGVLLDGKASLKHKGAVLDLNVGDVIFGVTGGGQASLEFHSSFRQVFINVPRRVFSERCVTPLAQRLGYLPAHDGIRHILSTLITTVANEIHTLDSDHLRPFDLSFIEFFIACAINKNSVPLVRGADGARVDTLHRVCQTIEQMLGDPELSVSDIANASGMRKRFVQNCFSYAGRTFADYVRKRRLKRSCGDLISPLYANQSIAEICCRWGVNAPTHFSRAFRSVYGMSPSAYRRQNAARAELAVH